MSGLADSTTPNAQFNQADKLKLWCVRRWLHLVPTEELKEYYERQGLRLALDKFYAQMVEHMIQTYENYGFDINPNLEFRDSKNPKILNKDEFTEVITAATSDHKPHKTSKNAKKGQHEY